MCNLIQGLVLHHQVYLMWLLCLGLGLGLVLGHQVYQVVFPPLHHQINQAMPMDRMCHVTPVMHRPVVL